jgi:CelD/BcsL family acetyltransferase involved in cellulose biosynthesis
MSDTVLDIRRPARTGRRGLTAEVVDLAWLRSRPAAWDRLVERACAPAPFFTRPVVSAHVEHSITGPPPHFVVARRGDALAALLPFTPRGARLGFGRRAHAAWTSPYVTNATPLVAADEMPEAIEALLDGMAGARRPACWLLPRVSVESPVGAMLRAAMDRRGWAVRAVSGFERAVLERRPDYGAYARSDLKPGRRKSLRRQRKRLAELGSVRFDSFTEGSGLRQAVADFLALEMRGWKGARRTALASRDETAAFARALFGSPGQGGVSPRADVLSLDGRPIAVSLALACGGTAHLLKTAYDEELRACAPGLVLEDEIIRAFHETTDLRRLDSASGAGSALDELYVDREPIADLVVGADPCLSRTAFAATVEAELARRAIEERLKRLLRPLLRRA